MSHVFFKDSADVDTFYIVWVTPNNTNDGSASDSGILQGATISTSTWTVPTGITKDADGVASVTIQGVVYAINTVSSITLSSGTTGTDYDLVCVITTSDSRTLSKTITIRCRDR